MIKKKHAKMSILKDFDAQVNEHIQQGWSVINANIVIVGTFPSYIAFLVK